MATFLALLELIRLKFLVVLQPSAFAEIEIQRPPAPNAAAVPKPAPAADVPPEVPATP